MMNELQEAGVGMMYLPGLENLIESQFHLLDVIEIEPQTLWYNKNANCDSFNFNPEQTGILREYDCNKLFHSVGFPVGGTILPASADFKLLNDHAASINPLWVSEHLSFNKFEETGKSINTNFLLPPLQTTEGIEVSVKAIRNFKSNMNRQFALETGVNYLQKRPGEIPDGKFVSEIATRAECYILLDLHNILANQINGRQTVEEFIGQLSPERICEIHVAGGFFHNNYYLDGHSGVSSNELFEMLEKVVKKLPCLKALIFEMLPDYLNSVSGEAICNQLEKMHRIWDNKGKDSRPVRERIYKTGSFEVTDKLLSVTDWEYTLGKAAIEQKIPESKLSLDLSKDKGIKIINELIFHFRASMLVSTLKLSTRFLKFYQGPDLFIDNIKNFFAKSDPEMFAFAVAKKYASYLEELKLNIPYFSKIVEYELASLTTLVDGQSRSVEFDYNPFPVIRSLIKSEIPEMQEIEMHFVLDIEPDELISNTDSLNYYSVFHN
jgi:uncharacterized protein